MELFNWCTRCWWLRMNIKVNYCCPFYGFNHCGDCELRGKIWDLIVRFCWFCSVVAQYWQNLVTFAWFCFTFCSALLSFAHFSTFIHNFNLFHHKNTQKSSLKSFLQHKLIFNYFFLIWQNFKACLDFFSLFKVLWIFFSLNSVFYSIIIHKLLRSIISAFISLNYFAVLLYIFFRWIIHFTGLLLMLKWEEMKKKNS